MFGRDRHNILYTGLFIFIIVWLTTFHVVALIEFNILLHSNEPIKSSTMISILIIILIYLGRLMRRSIEYKGSVALTVGYSSYSSHGLGYMDI